MDTVVHKGKEISYKLVRRKGAKQLTLSIKGNGLVSITRPWWVRESSARTFLHEQLDWIHDRMQRFVGVDDNLLRHDTEHYQQYKDDALQVARDKVAHWNQLYGFSFNKITIGRGSSRWGSCSSKGNLRFNYKILFLSEEFQDYLVVHELCHLKEMNHSNRFWGLVEKQIPNYKDLRKRLKQYDF